ncbi:MAG: SIS domain-containing protein [bacterium]
MKVKTDYKKVFDDKTALLQSKKAAKEVVSVVGFALGNLIWRINQGNFKIDNLSSDDIKRYKGTKYFILGGSIGTNGYTKVLLPILAQKQIKNISGKDSNIPEILNTNLTSTNAGALGAFHAFNKEARFGIIKNVKTIYEKNKIPILAMIDIGGTKINLILACLDQDGELNSKILKNHFFPTRRCDSPEDFYQQLVSYIRPVLDSFKNSTYQLLPYMAIGQPGRILDPKGIIDDGAHDLGICEGAFCNCNPSYLCQKMLHDIGYKMDVYVCNDGIAQFNGLLMDIKINNLELWQKISSKNKNQIMYLGIGTGLGSGYGTVYKDGTYKISNFREAYKIKATEEWEKIKYESKISLKYFNFFKLPHIEYEYGEIISSKFFRKYMHLIEYCNILNKKQLFFIPYTGLEDVPNKSIISFLKDIKNLNSPLNSTTINKILEQDIVSSKAEQIVDLNKNEITKNLKKILETYSEELSGTLVKNIKKSHYKEVVSKVILTKKNGNTVFFVGIGKSHSIADNLAERYRNLGINSMCLELTGANSENLTNIKEGDLIFMLSNSGKSWEILNLIEFIKRKGCNTVAITGDPESRLAHNCDFFINSKVEDVTNDIIRLPEAPTTTTTSALAVGTAIGVVSCHYFNYSKEQFYLDHPNFIYETNIKFEGAFADPNFSIEIKIEDIFKRFAKSIGKLNKTSFHEQTISLLKKILVSHYNKRTVFITGSGSSLHVAEKISATLTSIGIDSTAINPAQLPHGDFAHIVDGDLLIIVSFSGETSHLKYIYDLAKDKNVDVALITSNENSTLAKAINPFCVIADSEIDDEKLVPIPGQKLFSSFLNLAVGDAVSVLLAWLIKTTHLKFATLGHRGGAIARADNNYQKYLNTLDGLNISSFKIPTSPKKELNDIDKHFLNLLEKNIKVVKDNILPENYTNEKLAKIINYELMIYRNRIKKHKQPVIIFGMGSIGLAYLARIFIETKKKIIFVENDETKLNLLQKGKEVRLSSGNGLDITIPVGESINGFDLEKIAAESLNADCIFIAIRLNNIKQLIDTILFITLRRYAYDIHETINFVFDENFQVYDNTLELLQYEIYRKIDDPNIKSYFDEFVGLVPSINEAIVPDIKMGKINSILIERYLPPLYIDQSKWKKRKGAKITSFSNKIIFENNFLAIHMRKLWMHNMAHSMIGYLGNSLNYKTIHESINDKKIEEIVKKAMESVGLVLYRRWDYSDTEHKSCDSYVEWCIKKYKNKYIRDTIDRICRDPERKLRENDRLVGPVNYIWRYDKNVAKDILIGVVAAIRYDKKKCRQLKNEVIKKIKISPKELSHSMDEYEKFIRQK